MVLSHLHTLHAHTESAQNKPNAEVEDAPWRGTPQVVHNGKLGKYRQLARLSHMATITTPKYPYPKMRKTKPMPKSKTRLGMARPMWFIIGNMEKMRKPIDSIYSRISPFHTPILLPSQ
jgi:hypothetical protein